MNDRISYNLPGYGEINVHFLEYTYYIYNFLGKFDHIRRMMNINQLGSLRRVYPGAHHTKHEYVISQLALITKLCHMTGLRDEEFRIGIDVNDFGVLSELGDQPTRGEILQILVLMKSIGHLPGTFATERAFLHHLRSNSSTRTSFKSGLPGAVEEDFNDCLERFNIYGINNFISLFLINRYRRAKNGNEIVNFCIDIMDSYIKKNKGQSNLDIIWDLYISIRKLSYLALDSLYTGVPFSLDLSSIFLSLGQYERQVFSGQSNFQNALDLLEGVVRNSVYMSPRSLLQESTCTEHALSFFESKDTGGDISPMRDLLEPSKENDRKLEDAVQSDESYSNENRFIVLNFDKEQPVKNPIFEDGDLVQWEKERRKGAGKTYSRFGAAWDPTRMHLRVSAAVRSGGSKTEEEKVFRIATEIAKSENTISARIDLSEAKRSKNQINIIEFICRSIWGWDRKYYFRGPIVDGLNPVYNSMGTTSISHDVQHYASKLVMKEHEEYLVDEANLLIDHLQDISYRGRTLCYAGSLVVGNQLDEDAEFDGAAFFLGNEAENRRITLAEAKGGNQQNPADAEDDLWEKADELGMDRDRLEVDRYDLGAVMSVFES